MYATCLFCTTSLGRNEALEHFPVGRRLAYDEVKGRLWVICRRCERWNLSPLETRWEAIEEAERAFRATRLRIATDNIGLARLKEGLELVRIGAPLRLELATWRYGDQFGRRRRKYMAMFGLGTVASSAALLGALGSAAAFIGAGVVWSHLFWGVRKDWRDRNVPTVFLTGDNDAILPLTKLDTWTAALIPIAAKHEWYLRVQHRPADEMDPARRRLAARAVTVAQRILAVLPHPNPDPTGGRAILKGEAALRALAALLPHASPTGGSARRIREAVGVLESSSSLDQLIFDASMMDSRSDIAAPASHLTQLPARMRLALEMVLHEEDERRAMEGELAALEQRWREAEEIASIADSLLGPADTGTRVDAPTPRAGDKLSASG